MVVRAQAFLVGLLLVAGLGRVLTYVEPPPVPSAEQLWTALLGARSMRMQVLYVAPDGAVSELGVGVIDLAAQRSSARVEVVFVGRYDEVVDRTAVYVRPKPGRWYRYLVTGTTPARGYELADLLRTAGPLVRDGTGVVRGVTVHRYRAGTLRVLVDAAGLPRRIEAPSGATLRAQLDLYDFGAAPAITPPPRFTSVDGLGDALRDAAAR